jgi:hypothetical protein
MTQVKLIGWRPGLNKVGLTKTLQAEFGLSLGDAKQATDKVLSGQAVTLPAPDRRTAVRVAGMLSNLGVDVDVTPEPVPRHAAG